MVDIFDENIPCNYCQDRLKNRLINMVYYRYVKIVIITLVIRIINELVHIFSNILTNRLINTLFN